MRVGLVSDSHGNLRSTSIAVELLHSQSVERVFHCGDIGSAAVIPCFDPWPTDFVFGNVDHDIDPLRQAILASGQVCHGRMGQIDIDGLNVALIHGDDSALLQKVIQSGKWDLVCHGHTHVPRHEIIGRTHVVNPGALYRADPWTIAIVDLPSLDVVHLPLIPPDR